MAATVRPSLALLLLLTLGACDGASPTAPGPGLTGAWSGSVALRGDANASDALQVQLSLTQNANALTGEMLDATGQRWPVDGSTRVFHATHQPVTSTCSAITFTVESTRSTNGRTVELAGSTSGRCFGTVSGKFALVRR